MYRYEVIHNHTHTHSTPKIYYFIYVYIKFDKLFIIDLNQTLSAKTIYNYYYSYFNILSYGFMPADDSPTDDRCRRRSRLLSEGEVVLLESVAHSGKRLPNGRFLTMHKRRRKKLTTRSLSNENAPALLDDIHHGQVQVRIIRLYYCFSILFVKYCIFLYIDCDDRIRQSSVCYVFFLYFYCG
jgi:hypothetical protein